MNLAAAISSLLVLVLCSSASAFPGRGGPSGMWNSVLTFASPAERRFLMDMSTLQLVLDKGGPAPGVTNIGTVNAPVGTMHSYSTYSIGSQVVTTTDGNGNVTTLDATQTNGGNQGANTTLGPAGAVTIKGR